jgi:hypothetical protein
VTAPIAATVTSELATQIPTETVIPTEAPIDFPYQPAVMVGAGGEQLPGVRTSEALPVDPNDPVVKDLTGQGYLLLIANDNGKSIRGFVYNKGLGNEYLDLPVLDTFAGLPIDEHSQDGVARYGNPVQWVDINWLGRAPQGNRFVGAFLTPPPANSGDPRPLRYVFVDDKGKVWMKQGQQREFLDPNAQIIIDPVTLHISVGAESFDASVQLVPEVSLTPEQLMHESLYTMTSEEFAIVEQYLKDTRKVQVETIDESTGGKLNPTEFDYQDLPGYLKFMDRASKYITDPDQMLRLRMELIATPSEILAYSPSAHILEGGPSSYWNYPSVGYGHVDNFFAHPEKDNIPSFRNLEQAALELPNGTKIDDVQFPGGIIGTVLGLIPGKYLPGLPEKYASMLPQIIVKGKDGVITVMGFPTYSFCKNYFIMFRSAVFTGGDFAPPGLEDMSYFHPNQQTSPTYFLVDHAYASDSEAKGMEGYNTFPTPLALGKGVIMREVEFQGIALPVMQVFVMSRVYGYYVGEFHIVK